MSGSTPDSISEEGNVPLEKEMTSKIPFYVLGFVCASLIVYAGVVTRLFVVHLSSCSDRHPAPSQISRFPSQVIVSIAASVLSQICYVQVRRASRNFEDGRKPATLFGRPITNTPQNMWRVKCLEWIITPLVILGCFLCAKNIKGVYGSEHLIVLSAASVFVDTKGTPSRYTAEEIMERLKEEGDEVDGQVKSELRDVREETRELRALNARREETSKQLRMDMNALQERLTKLENELSLFKSSNDSLKQPIDRDLQIDKVTEASPVHPIPGRPPPLFISGPLRPSTKSRPNSGSKKAGSIERPFSSRGRPESQRHPGSAGSSLSVPGKSRWR